MNQEAYEKWREEQNTIYNNIKKKLNDEFPQLTETQITRVANYVWEKAHATGEFDYYTQDIIDLIEIVLEKESNL